MAYCGLKTSIRFFYHTVCLGTKYSTIMCALIAGPVLPIKEKFAFVLAEFLFKKEFLTNFWKNLSRKQGNHGRILGWGRWYGAPPYFCDNYVLLFLKNISKINKYLVSQPPFSEFSGSAPSNKFNTSLLKIIVNFQIYIQKKCVVNHSPSYYETDLFSLYVLFSHFRQCDDTPENCSFQMSPYTLASTCISMHKLFMKRQKPNSLENITWSELGKQNIQAKKVE